MNENILVVGAGASGLAFALECISHGLKVRLIDKRPTRSLIGKATGITLGVWNQLSKFNITPRIISDAIPMKHFAFYDNGKSVANIPVPPIHGDHLAHLYPQGELERKLEALLSDKGIYIEYGTRFQSIEKNDDNEAIVTLFREQDSFNETCQFKWVVGADGAHSHIRRALDIPFVGRDYPEQWSVAEIETHQWSADIQAKLYFEASGVGLFLSQPAVGRVQGILNADGVSSALKQHFSDANILYERDFKVSLRRVVTPRAKSFWLIGDAAHVQSPVGGQGLNLAIWDGITLAQSLVKDDLSVEQKLSKRARKVLFFTDFDYRMLATKSRMIQFSRNTYWSFASRHPSIAYWFFKMISGVW